MSLKILSEGNCTKLKVFGRTNACYEGKRAENYAAIYMLIPLIIMCRLSLMSCSGSETRVCLATHLITVSLGSDVR